MSTAPAGAGARAQGVPVVCSILALLYLSDGAVARTSYSPTLEYIQYIREKFLFF